MDKQGVNKGIQISGGTFNAENVAVGDSARAYKTVYAVDTMSEQEKWQEIRDRLDELEKVLDTHAAALSNADEVRDSTAVVSKELSKDKPNKLTVISVLNGIAESVRSVTAITVAVEALRHAITALL
jgi:hypothetical protein